MAEKKIQPANNYLAIGLGVAAVAGVAIAAYLFHCRKKTSDNQLTIK